MSVPRPQISIVVPCWRDSDTAIEVSRTWAEYPAVREIVLAGVEGYEPQIGPAKIGKLVACAAPRPSRGEQLNLGAARTTADTILFHHIDSILAPQHLEAIIEALLDPDVIGGGFHRAFDERHPSLRWLEKWERLHSRAFGTIYGDQSVFVRRDVFARLGGFAAIPLMEDVEFSKRLRRAGRVALLDPPMRSSPRRQMEDGAWRVTGRNLFFLVAYRAGMSPQRLHKWYYANTEDPKQPTVARRRSPKAGSLSAAE